MIDAIPSVLGHQLLGGTLLLVLTVLLLRVPAIRDRPVLVFWMWMLVLVRFLVPAQLAFDFSLESLVRGALGEAFILDVGAAAPAVALGAPSAASSVSALDVLALIWLAGVAGLTATTIVGVVKTRLALARLPAAPAAITARASAIAASIGLRRAPRVVVGDRGPLAFGVVAPIIALPSWLGTGAALDQILAHELAHIRRRDPLWSLIARAAFIAFFFWPPMWWARARLALAREQACDHLAIVLARSTPREYANTLVEVSLGSTMRLSPSFSAMAAHRSQLSSRIELLLGRGKPGARLRVGALGVAALAMQLVLGMPGADAEARAGVGALDCVVTPGLGARILSAHPDADRDGDGQLSRAEICAHQRRSSGGPVGLADDAISTGELDTGETGLGLADMCIEELRCSEPSPTDFILESRE